MAVRSRKKNVIKFKWTKELIITLSVLVVLIISAVVLALPTPSEKIYNEYASVSATLSSDHVFVKTSYKGLLSKIEKEDDLIFVYYGSTTCTNCVSNIEVFNSTAKSFEVKKVYYLESTFVDKLDEDKDEDMAKRDAWEVELGGVTLTDTPSLWVYQGGKLIFNSSDNKDEDTDELMSSWNLIAAQAFSLNKK